MKLATAQKNAMEIHRRIQSVAGCLATPQCRREAVRISRVWVFGSTVKGSLAPNDLDLLVEIRPVGRSYRHKGRRIDRDYYRRFRIRAAVDEVQVALRWVKAGMRHISLHRTDVEEVAIDHKVMLYPRNDFAKEYGL